MPTLFRSVYVPVNPRDGGVAAGCELARGYESHGRDDRPQTVSRFLGPEYSNAEIKSVLDNCKLTYAFLGDAQLVQQAVETLARGQLVGWFQGRRSLGNRSIFANPVAPYALENLNAFLNGARRIVRTDRSPARKMSKCSLRAQPLRRLWSANSR